MAKNQKPQPEGWRTTRTERINYYIGDIGRSLEGYIVTAMMTLFLLFQGIDLIKVSAAILAVKIIDALDDIFHRQAGYQEKQTSWEAGRRGQISALVSGDLLSVPDFYRYLLPDAPECAGSSKADLVHCHLPAV